MPSTSFPHLFGPTPPPSLESSPPHPASAARLHLCPRRRQQQLALRCVGVRMRSPGTLEGCIERLSDKIATAVMIGVVMITMITLAATSTVATLTAAPATPQHRRASSLPPPLLPPPPPYPPAAFAAHKRDSSNRFLFRRAFARPPPLYQELPIRNRCVFRQQQALLSIPQEQIPEIGSIEIMIMRKKKQMKDIILNNAQNIKPTNTITSALVRASPSSALFPPRSRPRFQRLSASSCTPSDPAVREMSERKPSSKTDPRHANAQRNNQATPPHKSPPSPPPSTPCAQRRAPPLPPAPAGAPRSSECRYLHSV
jgi:hypothetical protein